MIEHFKDKLISKINEMKMSGCTVCDIRKMDKPSLMYHLAFVHKGIDEHLISEVARLEKTKEDTLLLKIENCSKTRIKMKRKSSKKCTESKRIKMKRKSSKKCTE